MDRTNYPKVARAHYYPSKFAIWNRWVDDEAKPYDYGVMYVKRNMGNRIGHLGMPWNFPRASTWQSVDYPNQGDYEGNKEMVSTSGAYDHGTGSIAMGSNDLTQDSSGGPWMLEGDYANSVNSWINHSEDPCIMNGWLRRHPARQDTCDLCADGLVSLPRLPVLPAVATLQSVY